MAVESGKNGTVKIGATPIADVTRWTFDKEALTSRYASNSTAGFKATVAGVKQGSGQIEAKWDSAAASPITEGTSVTLLLFLNVTENFSVPAIIKNFKLLVDIDNGEVTGFTADFETNGAWTEPTLT